MSISKTRQKLVDVARQLFAKNGLENTTMNDIAVASGKGRRTLYTYFKSKEDVYYAVIESELERLSDKMDEVAAKKIRPQDKIIELIYTHLNMIKETVMRNGNLRAFPDRLYRCPGIQRRRQATSGSDRPSLETRHRLSDARKLRLRGLCTGSKKKFVIAFLKFGTGL